MSPNPIPSLTLQIHQRAVELSGRYKKAEAELLETLDQVDLHRVYLKHGHSSLFLYVVRELGLSESVAYNLIAVARKAREVPELKDLIASGSMTLSNARRITPILTKQNKTQWLAKATSLSQRQLEKEVAKIRPQSATLERASYVTENRVKLEIGLSEKDMLALRRVQDLLCQARGRAVSLEETIVTMTEEHLRRRDPVRRAERQIVKKGALGGALGGAIVGAPKSAQEAQPVSIQARPAKRARRAKRVPIPANLLHQVRLRDQGRCTYIADTPGTPGASTHGKRCNQSRWIEIHHKIPISEGGANTLENLETLCTPHHNRTHSTA